MLTLWTIQTFEAFKALQDKEILYGDWRRICYRDFKRSYLWMISQMEQRGLSTLGKPPFWAWEKKPDLRQRAHLESGKKGVRLKLQVPRNLVLFSNWEAWHFVLNDWRITAVDTDDDNVLKEPKNWEVIFDEKISSTYDFNEIRQACLPYLDLIWVTNYQYFTAR